MPKGEGLPLENKPRGNPSGEIFTRLEQPRGEVLYYVKANGTKNLERFRARTPTFANIPAMIKLVKGCDLADVPEHHPDHRPLHQLHGALRWPIRSRLPMVPRALRNLVSKPATRRYPYRDPAALRRRPRRDRVRRRDVQLLHALHAALPCRRDHRLARGPQLVHRAADLHRLQRLRRGLRQEEPDHVPRERRHVHTLAEVGPDGERPGHEEWHGADPAVAAAAKAEASAS